MWSSWDDVTIYARKDHCMLVYHPSKFGCYEPYRSWDKVALLKSDSNTGFFLLILWNLYNHHFYKTPLVMYLYQAPRFDCSYLCNIDILYKNSLYWILINIDSLRFKKLNHKKPVFALRCNKGRFFFQGWSIVKCIIVFLSSFHQTSYSHEERSGVYFSGNFNFKITHNT